MDVSFNVEPVVEGAKHLLAKCVTVGASAVLAQLGAVITQVATGQKVPGDAVMALLYVAGYAMWTQAIVPAGSELFAGKTTAAATAVPIKSMFELF